ncbi:aminotransferase class III-fold pyridoxal phosphate-dependent enzyme [Micromonospora noduli]|uniref:aminotransferase class III-fold pyridoxal phosphate-dependent enzyme n=1 Tax=Micromonospora noduli TaxID=709876 RepID=UPI001788E3D2|nr:aminotransferase class III-fold pyridoxal phosphate-dependent enzyme [Micromonospora noduli]
MTTFASHERVWAPSVDGGRYEPDLHVTLRDGRGVWATTAEGQHLLDANSGLWHLSLGYAPPDVTDAAANALRRLGGTSLLRRLHTDVGPLVELLTRLLAPMDPVFFFATSGSEAVDAALRIAAADAHLRGRTTIAYLAGAYHGASLGPLALNDSPRYRSGAPSALPTVQLPSPAEWSSNPASCATRVEHTFAQRGADLAAVIVEPIQCVGGMVDVPGGYLRLLAALAKAHDCLLIADEVSTGVFRADQFVASTAAGFPADVVVLAKGLTGGLSPMAVVAVERHVADRIRSSVPMHRLPGSTQAGDPVGCACAVAVLRRCLTPELMQQRAQVAVALCRQVTALSQNPAVDRVSGSGHLWGIRVRPDLVGSGPSFIRRVTAFGLDAEMLLHPLSVGVIPLVPALTVTEPETSEMISRLEAVLNRLG